MPRLQAHVHYARSLHLSGFIFVVLTTIVCEQMAIKKYSIGPRIAEFLRKGVVDVPARTSEVKVALHQTKNQSSEITR